MVRQGHFSVFAAIVIFAVRAWGDTPGPVPVIFTDLFSSLSNSVFKFRTTISTKWNGAQYPVAFAAQLSSANANNGAMLADPQHYPGVLMELDGLQAMGVKAILVNASFPVLYSPFYQTQAQYLQYVNFFAQVAQDVKARGLKLIVQDTVMLDNNIMAVGFPGAFYKTLNWSQYQSGRVQNTQNIIQAMHPDYLVVIQEPDTESLQTGQSLAYTPSGAASTLNLILAGIQSMRSGVKIGAGVGSWDPQYQPFIQAFLSTSIDFIDLHIFEVTQTFLPVAQSIADMAIAAGKGVSVSGAWLCKIRDSELQTLGNGGDDPMSARDPFNFWEPLDNYFLNTMVKFAHWKQMQFFAPFFSQYFRAYLPYNSSTQNLTPAQINVAELNQEAANLPLGVYTNTGVGYARALLSLPDTVPPLPPTGLSGISGLPTGMTLNWNASTDNVGVGGYIIYRDGLKVATTSQTYYQDSGLAGATAFAYFIRAYDVAGNLSSPSATITAVTRDVIPPSTPTGMTVTLPLHTEIQFSWQAAQENVAIGYYRVFRGSDAQHLSQLGLRASTQYIDYPVNLATT